MLDQNTIREIITQHKQDLAERFKVKDLYIFGSYARGENKKDSDVDILVDFIEPIGLFKFMELEEYLRMLLHAKIDLVSRKALKPRIGERILKEAVGL